MFIWRCIKAIFKSFFDFFTGRGMMLAGSISFFSMTAIVPFCLVLITIFGYFLGGHAELLKFFTSKLVGFFPKITSEITNELGKLISYKGIGQFTFILYVFLSYQLFSALEAAINEIFKIKSRRNFIVSFILSLFIITIIIAIIILSFGASSAVPMLKALGEHFPELRIGRLTSFLLKYVIPLILVFLTAAALYIILPKKKVKIMCAFRGALFTAIFLEAAKHLFTSYVVKVARLGTIYGPLSAFVIFLLWVYYSSCIFLIGAGVVSNLETSGKK